MPRLKREKSNTKIYHVMSRALNKQILFESDKDCLVFLSYLKEAKEEYKFAIYAYCLMSNHFHLVIQDKNDNLSSAIQKICQRYSKYYNAKNDRTGYVFNDRFHSEAIEDKEYFLTCIRYVHQNPVKALICKQVNKYKFTSYHAYKNENSNYLGLVDCKPVYKIISKEDFVKFNNEMNHDKCMDMVHSKLSDNVVAKMLYKISNVKNNKEFQHLDEAKKCYYILKLLDYGIPILKLSRVSGLTYGKIQRIKKGTIGNVKSLTYYKK